MFSAAKSGPDDEDVPAPPLNSNQIEQAELAAVSAVQSAPKRATMMDAQKNEKFFKEIQISFYDVVEYFDGMERSIREGEKIFKAGGIYMIGISPPPSVDEITGFVVTTSAMTSKPHEIKLKKLSKQRESWVCTCTCKAGEGAQCKHIAACLIRIIKEPRLEMISCTELTQKWGKAGKSFVKQFSSVNASNLCQARKKVCIKNDVVSKSVEEQIFKEFLEARPTCILAQYFAPRSSGENLQAEKKEETDQVTSWTETVKSEPQDEDVPAPPPRQSQKKNNLAHCGVPQCNSYNENGITMHQIPKEVRDSKILLKKWSIALRMGKPFSKYFVICSRHFKDKEILVSARREGIRRRTIISKAAFPTQNLPKSSVATKNKSIN